AGLRHPGVALAFRRDGTEDRWTIEQPAAVFGRLVLELPAASDAVASVLADGKPVRWRAGSDDVFAPRLRIELPFGRKTELTIRWRGQPIGAAAHAVARTAARDGLRR